MNGQQQGDPAKLAAALVQIVDQENPPLRWVAGADAVAAVEQKARDLLAQLDAYRDLSTSLAHDDALAEQIRRAAERRPTWSARRAPGRPPSCV